MLPSINKVVTYFLTYCIERSFSVLVKSCGNPGTIRRGFFIGSSFNVGDTVEYRCAHGFKILGSSISKCKPHGTWTARPKCVGELCLLNCSVLYA